MGKFDIYFSDTNQSVSSVAMTDSLDFAFKLWWVWGRRKLNSRALNPLSFFSFLMIWHKETYLPQYGSTAQPIDGFNPLFSLS